MSDRQKTPWWIWTAAALFLVLMVYSLSYGPETFLYMKIQGDNEAPEWLKMSDRVFYAPVYWCRNDGPLWISEPVRSYEDWWVALSYDLP